MTKDEQLVQDKLIRNAEQRGRDQVMEAAQRLASSIPYDAAHRAQYEAVSAFMVRLEEAVKKLKE